MIFNICIQEWYDRDFNLCVQDNRCFEKEVLANLKNQYNLFCGTMQFCREKDNPRVLSLAKTNAEKFYSVVGLTEDFTKTFRVLETFLPRFFLGATKIYLANYTDLRVNTNTYEPITNSSRRKLMKTERMRMELEFYDFIAQRLDKQYNYIFCDEC